MLGDAHSMACSAMETPVGIGSEALTLVAVPEGSRVEAAAEDAAAGDGDTVGDSVSEVAELKYVALAMEVGLKALCKPRPLGWATEWVCSAIDVMLAEWVGVCGGN